jgi:flagellar hook-associated protein 3 FlgL
VRITDTHFSDLERRSITRAKAELARAQETASTGLRVVRPSDDPVASAIARRQRNAATHAETLRRASETGRASLEAAEGALSAMSDVLTRVQELAIQAANGTLSAADRRSMASEIDSLRVSLLARANEQVDGQYVLGGLRSDTAPYDVATGAFVGDRTVRTLELAPGFAVPVSVAAGEVLSPPAGVDVPLALESLRDALMADDVVGIRAGIDDARSGLEQVLDARASVGASMASFEQAGAVALRARDTAREAVSNAVEADAFDALSSLVRAQTALERAITLAARLPPEGLAQMR